MGRLVVAAHLPDHGLTILHVVPERIVAPRRGRAGGIDADVVLRSAHDDLFAPVAEDVALEAGGCLGVVVGQRASQRLDGTTAILEDDAIAVAHLTTVKGLFLQVTVPVDAHVKRHTIAGQRVNMVIGDATDG